MVTLLIEHDMRLYFQYVNNLLFLFSRLYFPSGQTTDFQKDSDHFLFIRKSWEVLPAQPLTGGEPQEVTWRRRRSQVGRHSPLSGSDPQNTSKQHLGLGRGLQNKSLS
jgi:hypothetical protein